MTDHQHSQSNSHSQRQQKADKHRSFTYWQFSQLGNTERRAPRAFPVDSQRTRSPLASPTDAWHSTIFTQQLSSTLLQQEMPVHTQQYWSIPQSPAVNEESSNFIFNNQRILLKSHGKLFWHPYCRTNKRASIRWQDSAPPRASNGGQSLCVQI